MLELHVCRHTDCDGADDMQGQLVLSPEVMKALREGTAVVALESTIISHGMPYPQVHTISPMLHQRMCAFGSCACRDWSH
jgi:pseudouridine-5'-phosphate glycosidase